MPPQALKQRRGKAQIDISPRFVPAPDPLTRGLSLCTSTPASRCCLLLARPSSCSVFCCFAVLFHLFVLVLHAQISQYIVARSKTPEEAYSDVWEVIMEMADRAANRGCNVPTEGKGPAPLLLPNKSPPQPDARFTAAENPHPRGPCDAGLPEMP